MLNKIKSFFDQNLNLDKPDNKNLDEQLQLASAALLIEIAYSDNDISNTEKQVLKKKLLQQFELSEKLLNELITLAESEVQQSNSAYEFIRLINKYFEADEKYALVKNMWAIAYADQQIDPYEEAMIRKLADLLYVPHHQFIRAKLEVIEQAL